MEQFKVFENFMYALCMHVFKAVFDEYNLKTLDV